MELPKKLGIGGGALFFLGITFGWIAFPPLLKSQVGAAVKLKKGAEMRDVWSKLPIPLDFKVYLFNVTNPDEIKQGAKPIVHEIGPYFYDEWKEKVDLVDREEDDTVEYSQRITWIFNPAKSNGLTGNEELVFPHLLMLGIIMTTMRDKPAMIGLSAKAVDSIFKKPDNVFVKATAHDIIFGGLPIDCAVKDFAGTAICSLLKENSDDLKVDGEDLYRFSLFGHKNGSLYEDRIRVKRGLKDVKDVGKVVEFKGEPRLSMWAEEGTCNEFNGTDSTIFHPYLFENEDVVSFSPDICRSMGARWDGTYTEVGGIKANHYTLSFGDMSTDPELKCFCPTEDTCLKKGLYDLFPCVNAPIVASLPHLYDVDEMYLQQVDGLRPTKEEHQISIDFEPITGTPMSAAKRLQFNMFIFPIDKVKTMKNFPTALLPLFWVEEGITLGDEFLDQLRMVFKMMKIVGIIKWMMLVSGLGLGGAAAGLEYKKRQSEKKLDITKVTPQQASRTESGNEKKWPLNVSTLQAAQVPPSLDRN
ncbi:sensory neuron membrane protein 1 isoform X2 [Venturia canescens]|nr:sensory neuron membrane protein 1 isoform X2 [Venturia canescens]